MKTTWIAAALLAGSAAPAAAQDTAWLEGQASALSALEARDGWQALEGGVRWRRIDGDGTGRRPVASDVIRFHYAGRLTDGTEFDSSWARNEPATYPLGMLIDGWQVALPMAGVGDTIEVAVPAALGYGPEGAGEIPGGATLFFKIQLLGIE